MDRNETVEHLRYVPVPPGDEGLVSAEKIGAAVERIVSIADPAHRVFPELAAAIAARR